LLFHSQAQGYAGPIDLLIGVDMSGHLTGIKVASQQETPRLGGQIISQPDWLERFVGSSLTQPEETNWALRKDHGEFDQLAGATITSRAVVDTLRQTLRYFDEQHAALLAQPAARQP
jgi:electron transport complex protein RnfG